MKVPLLQDDQAALLLFAAPARVYAQVVRGMQGQPHGAQPSSFADGSAQA